MATGDDLELGATNTASTVTHLQANVPHHIGLLVTNSGSGGTTSPVTAIDGEADEIGVRGFGGTGVIGETFKGIGVRGKATGGTGVSGDSKNGIGVAGQSSSKPGVRGFSGDSHGVEGVANGKGSGVHGKANRGIGVMGESRSQPGVHGSSRNNHGVVGMAAGNASGVHGTSVKAQGVYGTGPLGVRGDGNLGVFGFGTGNGVGVWGGALGIGVLGSTGSKSGWAGYFDGNVFIGGDLTKTGLGSCVAVPFRDGSLRRLYSIDSPECWFEDFGEAKLVKGKAEVTVDPGFAAVVRGAYHIFITPYGDSNGLYVSRRAAKRFVVREQKGGTSTLTFSYRIVARRKDIAGARLQKVTPPPKPKLPPARVQKLK